MSKIMGLIPLVLSIWAFWTIILGTLEVQVGRGVPEGTDLSQVVRTKPDPKQAHELNFTWPGWDVQWGLVSPLCIPI